MLVKLTLGMWLAIAVIALAFVAIWAVAGLAAAVYALANALVLGVIVAVALRWWPK